LARWQPTEGGRRCVMVVWMPVAMYMFLSR